MALPASGPVSLLPWAREDLPLLRRMNTADMWAHLGGPEAEAKLRARHQRYCEAIRGDTRMFAIVFHGEKAGSIGYWIRTHGGQEMFETGWMVVPEAQGQGVATAAARIVTGVLAADVGSGAVHAYPSVHHPASNAVCRKVGFHLCGPMAVEFPEGHFMDVNDWMYTF